ncbi:MAG: hypothetical protein U5K43_13855 [Halofilum sp. (in: g-proteobacteria)]|nr:hypothetical protein [Halofilum sp. (in: g-proteobacteria)]
MPVERVGDGVLAISSIVTYLVGPSTDPQCRCSPASQDRDPSSSASASVPGQGAGVLSAVLLRGYPTCFSSAEILKVITARGELDCRRLAAVLAFVGAARAESAAAIAPAGPRRVGAARGRPRA